MPVPGKIYEYKSVGRWADQGRNRQRLIFRVTGKRFGCVRLEQIGGVMKDCVVEGEFSKVYRVYAEVDDAEPERVIS